MQSRCGSRQAAAQSRPGVQIGVADHELALAALQRVAGQLVQLLEPGVVRAEAQPAQVVPVVNNGRGPGRYLTEMQRRAVESGVNVRPQVRKVDRKRLAVKGTAGDRGQEAVDLVLWVQPARPPLLGRQAGQVGAAVQKGVVGHEAHRGAVEHLAREPGFDPLHRLVEVRLVLQFQRFLRSHKLLRLQRVVLANDER